MAGITYARLDACAAPVKVEYRVLPDGTASIDDMKFETGSKAYHRLYRQAIEAWLKSGSYRPEELGGQPVVTRISVPVEFISGQGYTVKSKADAVADGEQERRQDAAGNESCEIAMGQRDKADRQVALDSPFKPTFTN